MDPSRKLRFLQLPETFAICRLPTEDGIPTWAVSGILFSVTRTPNELSIVCPQANLPGRAPAITLNVTQSRVASDFAAPVFAHSKNGKNDFPETKIAAFAEFMAQAGDKVDYAGFKMC